jgi:hypothetical protein
MVSEVESFVFNHAHAAPSGVNSVLDGGLGITALTELGKKFKFARTVPL